MHTLTFLTIGQAPRPDLSAAVEAHLPTATRVRHAGVLDGLTRAEAEVRFGPVDGGATLLSRLADGGSVTLDAGAVGAALRSRVDQVEEEGADVVVLLCTGEFPSLRTRRARLVEPDALVTGYVATVLRGSRVGVVVPLPEQVPEAREKWRAIDPAPLFAAASPYADDDRALCDAAFGHLEAGATALMLDCMGYGARHRRALRAAGVTVPVLTPAAVVGAALEPLLS
ncbi:AroM family protein [Streptomyces sp. NBC_00102]|uniref:AroM family protein n=1 Tax=Streptomyces sp. NBC_00102 TaxID=2975652 RepID=UPI0022520445|nr:AroM family protein [Streptomyces sp. NBC_00102]MCX5402111.1 AroM family protein [Streptomyces sp. NBC_00102]